MFAVLFVCFYVCLFVCLVIILLLNVVRPVSPPEMPHILAIPQDGLQTKQAHLNDVIWVILTTKDEPGRPR